MNNLLMTNESPYFFSFSLHFILTFIQVNVLFVVVLNVENKNKPKQHSKFSALSLGLELLRVKTK